MHYYDFHIADYRKDTQHLSPIEHYIYRSLIDWYFLDESPITQNNPTVIRRLSLGSTADAEALISGVFADFFELKDGFWHHHRIDSMLADYQAKAEVNRQNGKKGGRPPKKEAKTAKTEPKETQSVIFANPSESESNPNQEPITNNQEPITNNHPNTRESTAIADAPTPKPKASPVVKPETVEQQIWDDWLQLRKNKKAPVTKTVVQGAIVEAGKAGMPLNDFFAEWCTRGSQGLKAEWLQNDRARKTGSATGAAPTKQFTVNGVGVSPVTVGNVRSVQEFFRRRGQEFHAEIGERDVLQDAAKSSTVIDI